VLASLGVVAAGTALSFLGVRASADLLPTPPVRSRDAQEKARREREAAEAAKAAEAAAKVPLDDEGMPVRSERVVGYTMEAELRPGTHSVRGSGTIVWRNTARVATDRLFVHLYLNAFKDGRTVFWRAPVGDFRGDPLEGPGRIEVERFHAREMDADLWPASPTTPGDPDDATDIEVPLPRPIQPGESLTIDMAWTSHLPTVTIRTGYAGSFHMVAQWFPKLARLEPDGTWAHFPFHRLSEFYADYGTYDVTVIAPKPFVIGAVGKLVSTEAAGEGSDDKEPRERRRYLAEDVHDFAFTAWDKFRSIEETTPAGVKLTCLFPEGYEDAARVELSSVKFGLGYFGAAFGRYPYETLTIVHPPAAAIEAGGMEYPTLITTGGSLVSGPAHVRPVEMVTLHELGHQWFYGLVGTNENRWPFLDEGLTTYAEMDSAEALWPDASAAELWGVRVGMPAIYRAGALQVTRDAAVSEPASAFVSGRDYGGLVYSRTGTTLRTLANVYGEDTVRRAIGAYARKWRFQHPTPDDLFIAVRDAVGSEAEAVMRTALTQPSSVDYVAEDVFSEPKPGGGGYRGHALVRRRGEIRLPVDVLLVAAGGSLKRVRWEAERAFDRIPYEGDEPLVAAVVDPEHRVLLDENLSNNAVQASGTHVAWRALEGAAFAGGVLARGILP
jgi:hypothetical protein